MPDFSKLAVLGLEFFREFFSFNKGRVFEF